MADVHLSSRLSPCIGVSVPIIAKFLRTHKHFLTQPPVPSGLCFSFLFLDYIYLAMNWFIEGDIKGCFDNIDHTVLAGLLNNKIKDARMIKLIYKFLKAGYVENWQYYRTYSGTPQGGLC